MKNSYNFARDAYFKEIGAVGYSVSEPRVTKTNVKSWQERLNNLRSNIQSRVNKHIGSFNGSIATALMLNEYNNIDKNTLKDLRATGLAHILSVSGMHLSLVAAIFFFSSRLIINLFPSIALRFHCKKAAALISLFGTLSYLLTSGMEVAAVRSFIMSSIIIIAIIIDRLSNPMRAIAFAASIILIFSPENIVHPSFQMSFAAVMALVACFEIFTKLKFDFSEFNLIQKILFYLLSLSFASLVAGLATTPFALYHFGQSANYSILANLLAVPITSFWLMPCVVLAFILYPLHLEYFPLHAMKYGIKLMLEIAHYVANLPHSVTNFIKMTDTSLLIITLGMIWFCIWRTNARLIGIPIILLGIFIQSLTARPDIFIDWQSKTIAITNSKKQLIF
jgi:competence protein ComEC